MYKASRRDVPFGSGYGMIGDVGQDREEERLSRELFLEGKNYGSIDRSTVAGILWLPALVAVLTAAIWLGQVTRIRLPSWTGLFVIGLLFWGFWRFARSGARPK